jgi:hypothetical protein
MHRWDKKNAPIGHIGNYYWENLLLGIPIGKNDFLYGSVCPIGNNL